MEYLFILIGKSVTQTAEYSIIKEDSRNGKDKNQEIIRKIRVNEFCVWDLCRQEVKTKAERFYLIVIYFSSKHVMLVLF